MAYRTYFDDDFPFANADMESNNSEFVFQKSKLTIQPSVQIGAKIVKELQLIAIWACRRRFAIVSCTRSSGFMLSNIFPTDMREFEQNGQLF